MSHFSHSSDAESDPGAEAITLELRELGSPQRAEFRRLVREAGANQLAAQLKAAMQEALSQPMAEEPPAFSLPLLPLITSSVSTSTDDVEEKKTYPLAKQERFL